MLVRIIFVAAASAAAFAVQKGKKHKHPVKSPGHDRTVPNTSTAKEFDKERHEHGSIIQWENQAEEEEENEEEEVKTIGNFIATSTKDDEELLPEFESLLSREIDVPLPDSAYHDYKATSQYDIEIANYASEVERICTFVKELEDHEVKIEGELLEYYGLNEQESDFTELHKQLKLKTAEVDMLNITINSMQAERKKLQEEVAAGVAARKELEVARNKIKDYLFRLNI